jgi:hypothetical protein
LKFALLLLSVLLPVAAGTLYSGDTSGWTLGGDGAIIAVPSVGTEINAPGGSTFVVVSNGPGDSATNGTFYRDFVVGPGGGSLTLSFWFVTDEFTGDGYSPGYVDSYSVTLTGPSSFSLTGDVSESNGWLCVDSSCNEATVDLTPIGLASFLNLHDYKAYAPADIPLLPGAYTLTFAVNDDLTNNDPTGDSGLVIQTVNLVEGDVAGVPEPASMVLLGAGLLLIARRAWRR